MNILKGIGGCLMMPFLILGTFFMELLRMGEEAWRDTFGRECDD